MKFEDLIKKLQSLLNKEGEKLMVDGVAGSLTRAALEKYDVDLVLTAKAPQQSAPLNVPHADNPAYIEGKKYVGKSEYDSKFNAFLSGFWKLVGVPSYKTIIGSTFAWCGLFIFAMNTEVGQKAISGAAGARNWATYGQKIDYKKNGIPKGAVVHINHASNCSSGSDNHVTFADGDCTAEEINRSGASFPGFGGNQGDRVTRSNYPVNDICEVRWPSEIALPGPITKSIGCTGSSSSESTR